MKVITRVVLLLGVALLLTACGRGDAFEIPAGSDVTIEKRDGVEVRGTLVRVGADQVVLESPGAGRTEIPRAEIRRLTAVSITTSRPDPISPPEAADRPDADGTTALEAESDKGEPDGPVARMVTRAAEYRAVTIPSGTLLPAALQSPVASDASGTEDAVRATLRRPVVVNGIEALPAGTTLHGNVVNAERPGRVKGRASVSFRFNRVQAPVDGRIALTSAPITRIAPATKKKDAAKIGAGAAGGAIVGGLLGGGDGAAKGAAVGGAAGTGVVLSTRGEEVRLATGTPLSVRLTAPLTVRVPVKP
jgi:hypothetical protein